MTLTPTQLQATLARRYATKQFDPGSAISAEAWDALLDSLVLAPSSFGLQPWKFLVVENPDIRARLREVSWNQPQLTDASRLVVIATLDDMTPDHVDAWMECLAAAQGKSADELAAYRGMIDGFVGALDPAARKSWNSRQCYIALGQLMASAATMGIDSCPLEGIDKAAYDQILGLNQSGYSTVVACALGYRSAGDKYAASPKARFKREQVVSVIG
jgi:nitroreductase